MKGEAGFSGQRCWGLCSHQTFLPCGQWLWFSQRLVSICGQQVQEAWGGEGGDSERSTLQHPKTLRLPVTLN